MLQIKVPITPERWDEEKEEFIPPTYQVLNLEHSLVSLSKWESKWNKFYLSKTEKTVEETIDYIKCMTVTKNVDPEVYNHLTRSNIEEINRYIEAPMTATILPKNAKGRGTGEQVSSELIYYWMISLNIPFECQKWHLNRLITLIGVCNAKNETPKKMSKRQIMNRNAALNAERRKKLNTRG